MILDGCHGAGGWAEGLRALGRHGLGVEYDPDMVATARAAGHECELGDVAAVDPRELLGGQDCEGLIFSPPCPSFSAAGKQLGRKDLPAIHHLIEALSKGVDARSWFEMHDERSRLTCEPMRWVMLTRPKWIALEQVPAVLPVWENMAARLREHGYSTWTGIVYAERYGVPQTRQRAVLLASRMREVSEPVATHRRYYPPGHRYAVSGNGDGNLPRWISMAEALSWAPDTIVNTRAERKTPGGNNFSADRPSWGLTEKTRSWNRLSQARNSGPGARRTPRPVESAPSYTIRAQGSGMHPSGVEWIHDDMPESTRQLRSADWPQGRPATTIAPGGHHVPGAQSHGAIRVSLEEAAMLQTFPADYPFQGTRTKKFMQVGNAVPPRMAEALLRTVLGMGPRRLEDREPVDLEGDRRVAAEQHVG